MKKQYSKLSIKLDCLSHMNLDLFTQNSHYSCYLTYFYASNSYSDILTTLNYGISWLAMWYSSADSSN